MVRFVRRSYSQHIMNGLSRAGAIAAIVPALWFFCAGNAQAQSWQWQAVARNADQGRVNTQSRVVLSSRDIAITYSAMVDNRSIAITSCRAGLGDIGNVHSVDNGGHAFLFVVLKPQRAATCTSGSRSIAMIPIANDATATTAIAAIMRACCQTAAVAHTRAPAPRASATATPPAATSVAASTAHWVENAGLFAFVRLHNAGPRPVNVEAGEIFNCRDVASGCGTFAERPVTVAPGRTATLAAVTSSNPAGEAAFSYRFAVRTNDRRLAANGASGKRTSDPRMLMSPAEVRAAQALALGDLRQRNGSEKPAAPAYVSPKLARRGSTRLGVGQRGEAMVRVGVGRDGTAQYATIISISNRALTAAALETAVSSTYSAAMRDGRPVDGNYVASFKFDGLDPALSSIPVWRQSVTAAASPAPTPSASLSPTATPVRTPVPTPAATSSPS
jgi:hypothetical protein